MAFSIPARHLPFDAGKSTSTAAPRPSGAVFDFHDITLQFRLLIPRAGSGPVKTVIDTIASATSSFVPVQQIANSFGAQTATPTDYPGIGFQLELLVSGLGFHLGDSWFPGKVNVDFTITRDTTATSNDVRILLPKILLRYTQGEDFSQSPSFENASWGNRVRSAHDYPMANSARWILRSQCIHPGGSRSG